MFAAFSVARLRLAHGERDLRSTIRDNLQYLFNETLSSVPSNNRVAFLLPRELNLQTKRGLMGKRGEAEKSSTMENKTSFVRIFKLNWSLLRLLSVMSSVWTFIARCIRLRTSPRESFPCRELRRDVWDFDEQAHRFFHHFVKDLRGIDAADIETNMTFHRRPVAHILCLTSSHSCEASS